MGISVIVAIIIGWILFARRPRTGADHSLGLPETGMIRSWLIAGQYELAEDKILSLNSEKLAQVMDFLSLTLTTLTLENWLKKSDNKDIPTLCLGVHFNHEGWLARGHDYAKNVSKEGFQKFFDYQLKSATKLLSIDEESPLIGEVYSRLIRVFGGEGDYRKAAKYFQKAIKLNPNMVWPYISFCELIQPKWGGNKEMIQDFLENLPENRLIRQIVELKLTFDAFQVGENYFEEEMESLSQRLENTLIRIDQEITSEPHTSIFRFMIYNYLAVIAQELRIKDLRKKYQIKGQNYWTLFPFGVSK